MCVFTKNAICRLQHGCCSWTSLQIRLQQEKRPQTTEAAQAVVPVLRENINAVKTNGEFSTVDQWRAAVCPERLL